MPKVAYLALALFFIPFIFAETKKEEKKSSDEIVMTGEYKWVKRNRVRFEEKLTSVFTPVGKDEWNVSFHFTYKKKDNNFVGTAKGSLEEGPLTGEVRNDGGKGKRTFTFSGNIEEGKLVGTHKETTKGRTQDTGIFTLSR